MDGKGYSKWRVFALMAGMALMCSSCVVHRYPRPHRHRPHRHKAAIVAEPVAATEQNKDCMTFEECLAMYERGYYGSTE